MRGTSTTALTGAPTPGAEHMDAAFAAPDSSPRKPSAPRLAIPWTKLFWEGAIIVASILLAFAIDSWAARRGEHARERQYLESLATEFAASKVVVVQNGGTRERARHAAAALIGQIQRAPAAPVDSLFWWLSGLSQQIEFNPPTAALDDMIASGGIHLIRSAELRQALAAYQPQLAQLRYADAQAWATWEQRIQPVLEGRVPRVDRIRRGTFATFETPPFGPSKHRTDWAALLGNRVFEDVLAERWLRLGVGQLRRDAVEQLIDDTTRLIQQALSQS